MNTRWILFVSTVAFGSAMMFSLSENNRPSAVQRPDEAVNLQAISEHSSSQSEAAVPVYEVMQQQAEDDRSLHQAQIDSEQQPAPATQAGADRQTITPDAFPDTSMLSTDQLAEPATTDEAGLEAERNAIDLYFPVEEQTAYELSEAEIESQRQQLEQQIAQQANVLQDRLPLKQADFDMPPLEQ